MANKLVIELEQLYKIKDKSEREQKLADFYSRNNIKPVPIVIETSLSIGEMNTITLKPDSHTFQGKTDPIYSLADEYFVEPNCNFNNNYYEQIISIFEEQNRISLDDENSVMFYSPELCYLLTAQQISIKKLQFTSTCKSTQHVINSFNWENEPVIINPSEYLETYIRAFSEGKSDFDKTYSKTIDNLYLLNNKNTIDFIDTLKKKYYPSCSTENTLGKSWNYVVNNYSNIINHQIIYDYGFNSGKVAQLEKTINDHPTIFQNFYTPFYYSEDVITENVFWRIINGLFQQITDFDLMKDTMLKEFKKLDLDFDSGFRQMSYYYNELRKFIRSEDSVYDGIRTDSNDYKIYISNNYSFWIELTIDLQTFLKNLFDQIEKPHKSNTETFIKKEIPAKYYALYHWILIEMGTEKPFNKNEYDKWEKCKIENFAKERYPDTKPQGFYRAFIAIDLTKRTAIAKDFENYKDIIIEISNNNAKIISYLRFFPN